MKKSYVFILLLCLILPCFAFLGCNGLFSEKAICKVGNQAYSSLAEAIHACQDGDVIRVYNDVTADIPEDKKEEYGVVTATIDGKTYVEYNIEKSIKIYGVLKSYKKPKIYGSIKLNKTSKLDTLEIINDYISLEDNQKNQPFTTAVQVYDGEVTINNCYIHPAKSINNEVLQENNVTPLNGVEILRKTNNGEDFNYILKGNEINGYNNFSSSSSSTALALISEKEGFQNLKPFTMNYQTNKEYTYDIIFNDNKFHNNDTDLASSNQKSGVYEYLKTNNSNLVKQDNFDAGSTLMFTGAVFGPEEKEDFTVYGKMNFEKVKNLHFIIVTRSGYVKAKSRENVTVKTYVTLS